jgi:hypothetical protein
MHRMGRSVYSQGRVQGQGSYVESDARAGAGEVPKKWGGQDGHREQPIVMYVERTYV